jgi:hypothetical protein
MVDRIKQMQEVQAKALELFRKKNTDYGDSFADYGVVGILVRMGDKLKRYVSVSNNGVSLVNDESLKDTLIDLNNYSAMALMLLNEKSEQKIADERLSMDGVTVDQSKWPTYDQLQKIKEEKYPTLYITS